MRGGGRRGGSEVTSTWGDRFNVQSKREGSGKNSILQAVDQIPIWSTAWRRTRYRYQYVNSLVRSQEKKLIGVEEDSARGPSQSANSTSPCAALLSALFNPPSFSSAALTLFSCTLICWLQDNLSVNERVGVFRFEREILQRMPRLSSRLALHAGFSRFSVSTQEPRGESTLMLCVGSKKRFSTS